MKKWGCDFLLVAALSKESFPAIHQVFKAKREPKGPNDTRNCYPSTLKTSYGRQYDLRLVCIDWKGGQNMAAVATQAIMKFRPKNVVLFGIAAVVPNGRKPGHILASEWIVNIEEIKKGKVDQPRPHTFPCERTLVSHIRDVFHGDIDKTVHIGWLISQPNLSKKAEYRDRLVNHVRTFTGQKNVIGLEMESGGLAEAIQDLPHDRRPAFMVVKGAVDWGNYHKNKAIQPRMAPEVGKFLKKFLMSDPVFPVTAKIRLVSRPKVPCSLLPRSGMGECGVYIREGDKQNAEFKVWAAFHLLVGSSNLEFISLWIGYYAQGCVCYSGEGKIRVDKVTSPSYFGHVDFECPPKLSAKTTYTLEYSSVQRPHLMQQTPDSIDAEDGDLVVEATFRVAGGEDFTPLRWVFRLSPGARCEQVKEIRQPPRLSDRELGAWKAKCIITDDEYQQMLAIKPELRYLAAVSIAESYVTREMAPAVLKLIKTLYWQSAPVS